MTMTAVYLDATPRLSRRTSSSSVQPFSRLSDALSESSFAGGELGPFLAGVTVEGRGPCVSPRVFSFADGRSKGIASWSSTLVDSLTDQSAAGRQAAGPKPLGRTD